MKKVTATTKIIIDENSKEIIKHSTENLIKNKGTVIDLIKLKSLCETILSSIKEK